MCQKEPVDVLAKLAAKFPGYHFELCKPPSFLLEIIQLKDDIILCYKTRVKSNTIMQDLSVKSLPIVTDSSVTGNPLDVPSCMEISMLNLSLSETLKPTVRKSSHYAPLTSHEALRVKGFFNLKLDSSKPIVILCENEVKLIRNNQCRNVNRVLHGSFHSEAWKTSFWSDYYKRESTSVESFDQMREIHFKLTDPSAKKSQCDVGLRSKSVLTNIDDINEIGERCCSVSVQFEWSTLSIKPPLDSSKISLLLGINLSNAPSLSVALIWRQLDLLQKYVDFLESNTENASKTPLPSGKTLLEEFDFRSCKLTKENVDTEMRKLLSEPIGCPKSLFSLEQISLAKLTDCLANPNSPSDFTHSLWNRLIGCESYELLQMCFTSFFKYVRSSTKSNLISKTNITRLAYMIQSDQMLLDSYIQLINPVECLLEIGIERLRQVLTDIFDCMKVSPMNLNIPNLPKYSEIKDSTEWIKVSKSWLTWISRLYASLNILYCAETALGSPQLTSFYPVVCKVVSELLSSDSNDFMKIESLVDIIEKPQRTYSLEIQKHILNNSALDAEQFDEWSLTLTSSSPSRKVTSIFYRSHNCPLPYINDDNDNPTTGDGNNVTLLNTTCGTDTTMCSANITCLDNVSTLLHCVESHKISDYFPFLNSN